MDVPAAGRDLANRVHDLRVGRLLQDVAARAVGKCLAYVLRVVLHRQDEHLHVGMLVYELRQCVEAAPLRHDDVEKDHVRLQRAGLEDRVAAVPRLADRLEIVLRLEHEPQPLPHHGVVVDDENARGHRHGTSATTVVPLPSVDSTSSFPSSNARRSRMPSSPMPSLVAVGSKPAPSSSTTTATASPLRVRTMLTLLA